MVDLCLVHLIDLGNREERKVSQNDKSESIEPGADISQEVKESKELDRVDDVLDQEDTSQLENDRIHVLHGHIHELVHLVIRRSDFNIQVLPVKTKQLLISYSTKMDTDLNGCPSLVF